jgi:hypothetical protein
VKFLVAILTSSKPELARLCYDTVIDQRQHTLQLDVVIVVNSLNAAHKSRIERAMEGTGVEIVETASNGTPGQGHNSLLALFQDRVEYDYLIPVDGDDLLYPSAFHQLEKFLPSEPHCVALQTNDSLTKSTKIVRHAALQNAWRLESWFDDQNNWWAERFLPSPFVEKLRHCVTPARPILLHRAALEHLPRESYGVDFTLYDDMIFFLNLCDAWYRRPSAFNLCFTSNTYMYVHNDVNPASMSNAGVDYDREEQLFRVQTAGRFENIRQWRLAELPHCQISNPGWYTTENKVAFAYQATERIDAVTASTTSPAE